MTRPWVTPQQVRQYTDIEAVKGRTDEKLAMDIFRAEQYAIRYTRNSFSSPEYAEAMPDAVVNAVILLAEAYAANAVLGAKQSDFQIGKGGMKSETFDDYSYTAAEYEGEISGASLGVDALLDGYVLKEAQGTVNMRLRRL